MTPSIDARWYLAAPIPAELRSTVRCNGEATMRRTYGGVGIAGDGALPTPAR
jgi:hypothetical protein